MIRPMCCVVAIQLLCAAAPYAVPLTADSCSPASPDVLAALGARWEAVAKYVRVCPIDAPDGSVPVTVAIVRIDKALDENAFAPQSSHPITTPLPTPLIRDAAGGILGDLQEGFPIDPPGRLRVTFADWRGGFPWRIDLYEAGVSAVPPHKLPPLEWNAKLRRYESGALARAR